MTHASGPPADNGSTTPEETRAERRTAPEQRVHTAPSDSRQGQPDSGLRSLGVSAEIADEIRHHILERADVLVQEGWSRHDALREAERRFGDVDRIRREMRVRPASRAGELFRSAGSDFRYALRGVRSNPGFALAVVATLALGVGAASSIFAVVDALLLRPLPYHGAERLVELNHAERQSSGYTPGIPTSRIRGWQEAAADLVDGWILWSHASLVRTDGAAAEQIEIVAVTPGADTLLGIPLLHGRAFSAEDARVGSPDVAILGREYFERIGGDPEIVGRTIRLETGPVTVVGVLRGGVRFPTWGGQPDLWIPIRDDITAADSDLPNITGFWARLRPGLTLALAQERVDVIATALQEREPLDGGWQVQLAPVGAHRMSADVRGALWTLSATVAAIFLIACVNAVNLLLVRTSARTRELAVRMAIGGSRTRILRQLLVEGLVLGGISGLAAIALAVVAVRALGRMVPWIVLWSSPHALEVELRTFVFTFVASLAVGTVLGLLPALQVVRGGELSPLARRPTDDSVDRRRLRSGLVVMQVALSMTLLAAAGLFVKSFAQLVRVHPGYDHERIAVATLGLSPTRYPDAVARAEFIGRLEEMLEAHPGIEAVTRLDGRGFRSGVALEPEGRVAPRPQPVIVPSARTAPDYLEVTGVELLAGRPFEASDAHTDAVIIDLDLARFLWSEDAVGRRFRLGEDDDWMTVVGVVRDLRLMGRDERDGPYQILYPAAADGAGAWVELAVRTATDPGSVLGVVRDAVRELDPEQTIWRLRTAQAALAEQEAEPRFVVTLMTLLAGIAVALAAVGLHGVLAYAVARRGRELAVRMAVGADARSLHRMVVGEGVAVAAAGVVLGIGGALVASRSIEHLLYDVRPHDPATLAVAAVSFLTVAMAASLLPAHRATRVNPMETLRRE